MKRHEYRDRVIKTLNFEQQIFKEFEQLCKEERVYPSQKLQELMIGELEKKAVGSQNPLNISYIKAQEKPLPATLDEWMQKIDSITEPAEAGQIEGFHKVLMVAAKTKFYELKRKRSIIKG